MTSGNRMIWIKVLILLQILESQYKLSTYEDVLLSLVALNFCLVAQWDAGEREGSEWEEVREQDQQPEKQLEKILQPRIRGQSCEREAVLANELQKPPKGPPVSCHFKMQVWMGTWKDLDAYDFLKERDEEIRELAAALKEREEGGIAPAPMFPPVTDANAPRRSRRVASTHRNNTEHECIELMQCKAELDQCKAELDLKQTELQLKTLGNLFCFPTKKHSFGNHSGFWLVITVWSERLWVNNINVGLFVELKRFQENPSFSGTTNTVTITAERKLEEGQRVRNAVFVSY